MKHIPMILVLLLACIVLTPFVIMVGGSLMSYEEGIGAGLRIIPRKPTLRPYAELMQFSVIRWTANTLFIGLSTALINLTLALSAAFALAKYRFRAQNLVFALLVAGILIPSQLMIVPSFLITRFFGLYNTIWGAIIPRAIDAGAIWLLTKYLRAVPDSIIDMGRIDGLGALGLLRRIIAPLAQPALIALLSIRMVTIWADYLWPLIILRKEELMTLALGVREVIYVFFINQRTETFGVPYMGITLAGAVLATIPGIILFLFVQRYFVDGLFAKTGGK